MLATSKPRYMPQQAQEVQGSVICYQMQLEQHAGNMNATGESRITRASCYIIATGKRGTENGKKSTGKDTGRKKHCRWPRRARSEWRRSDND